MPTRKNPELDPDTYQNLQVLLKRYTRKQLIKKLGLHVATVKRLEAALPGERMLQSTLDAINNSYLHSENTRRGPERKTEDLAQKQHPLRPAEPYTPEQAQAEGRLPTRGEVLAAANPDHVWIARTCSQCVKIHSFVLIANDKPAAFPTTLCPECFA